MLLTPNLQLNAYIQLCKVYFFYFLSFVENWTSLTVLNSFVSVTLGFREIVLTCDI